MRLQLLTQSSTSDRLPPGSLLRAAEVAGAAQAFMQLSPARHRLSAAHPCSRVRPTRRPHFSAPALLRPSRRACLAAQARTNQPPCPPHLLRSVPAPSRTHRRSSANPASAMADPIARSRSSRAVSSTSSRRDANDRPSPIGAAKDKKDPPALDWSKFNLNFTVKHHPFPRDAARPAKKRKRNFARKPELEENAFDKSLSTLYTVEPAKWWNGTKRYRKFTIATETFRTGETVYVKPDENEAPDGPLESWVAKVLEVRAASEQHVFLRVFWMYRPEDLPGGRRPYHGDNEVIASNRMQIIDALTVNGKADVKHWTEEDGDDLPDADQLFWRQTFDWANGTGTGVLSSLRKHCVDEAPFNPDSLLVHCDACDLWLHSECLEIEAVKQAHAKKGLPDPNLLPAYQQPAPFTQAAENGDGSTHSNVDVKAKIEMVEPAFMAEVKTDSDGKSYILLKGTGDGQEGEELKEKIRCLKCDALIE